MPPAVDASTPVTKSAAAPLNAASNATSTAASNATSTAASNATSTATPTAAPAPHPVQAARALLKKLHQDFPSFRDCLPLAIGIDKQIVARQPDVPRKLLRIALGQHTNSLRYLKTLEKATHRFDLDGQQGEALTDEHRKHAATTLRERFKKEADQRRAQRAAEEVARATEAAARAAEEAARLRADKLNQLAAKFAK